MGGDENPAWLWFSVKYLTCTALLLFHTTISIKRRPRVLNKHYSIRVNQVSLLLYWTIWAILMILYNLGEDLFLDKLFQIFKVFHLFYIQLTSPPRAHDWQGIIITANRLIRFYWFNPPNYIRSLLCPIAGSGFSLLGLSHLKLSTSVLSSLYLSSWCNVEYIFLITKELHLDPLCGYHAIELLQR